MRPRLRSFEMAWTDAAFDGIYPEPRALAPQRREDAARCPHGVVRLQPARFFQELLFAAPLEQSLGLRVAVWIVALAPLFTLRKFRTIAQLHSEDRVKVLEKLMASPIYLVRQLVVSLKAMATLLYARSPHVRARMLAPVGNRPGELVRLRTKTSVVTGGAHGQQAAE